MTSRLIRLVASAVSGSPRGTRDPALFALGAAAHHTAHQLSSRTPPPLSAQFTLPMGPKARKYSASAFAGTDGNTRKGPATVPKSRKRSKHVISLQRRSTTGSVLLELPGNKRVGFLLTDIKAALGLNAALHSIVLQLVVKRAAGAEHLVALDNLDTLDEALEKALRRPATHEDKLRIIVAVDALSTRAGAELQGPPLFVAPTEEELCRDIDDVAKLVSLDIATSSNLDKQREMAGPLLLQPFPVSTLDGLTEGGPGLAAEFFPYKGSYAPYRDAQLSTNVNHAQQRHVVAVVQASGSGKTRLAYADGQDTRLVVVARVWKSKESYTPVWLAYEKLARHWACMMPHLNERDRCTVSESALAVMRLLAACHVSFVAKVLQRVGKGEIPAAGTDASATMLREAALRSLRNSKGDDTVSKVFLRQLQAVMSTQPLAMAPDCAAPAVELDLPVALIDHAAVDRFCADTDAQLRALLWPGAEVVIWWDEANGLIDSPAVFEPRSTFRKATAAAPLAGLQDGFYGLMALCADLADSYRWLQSVCGTWLEITARAVLPKISPLRGRVTCVFHASYISVDDMVETLRHYLEVNDDTVAALRPQLAQFVGRPIYFYNGFMPAVWSRLRASRPSTAAALAAALKDAASYGFLEARRDLYNVIEKMWVKDLSPSLCMQLYAALRMNNGIVELKGGAGADALRDGILVLRIPPEIGAAAQSWTTRVNLHDEPMCASVLGEIGDEHVRNTAGEPLNDPIYRLLATSMKNGGISGFGLTTSVKGSVLELAFAWHLVRFVLLNTTADGKGPTLSAALEALCPPDFVMPARAFNERLVISSGRSCVSAGASPAGTTDLHRLCEEGAERRVLFSIQESAGADVAALTVQPDGTPASVVLVQAKAKKSAALVDCLRAASPAWQYTVDKDRKAAIAGLGFEPSPARAAFESVASPPAATAARFSSAFRVALCATGFRPESIASVNALNLLEEGSERSPIILCRPSQATFGKLLNDQFEESCKGPVTSGTTALAYLLPQEVGEVTKGRVNK